MKQSSKRLSSMVLAVLFLVGAFVVFFDLIQPTYVELESLKAKQASTSELLKQETGSINQLKSSLNDYKSNPATQSTLALAMPSGPDIAGALAQIYGIASANNLAVQSVNISSPTTQLKDRGSPQALRPWGVFSLQITMGGSYENLKGFLSNLETNLRVFDLTSLGLQSVAPPPAVKGATPASNDNFNYSMSISTYYQVQ